MMAILYKLLLAPHENISPQLSFDKSVSTENDKLILVLQLVWISQPYTG